jgi:Heterokaryon incompatibility protein (HET)
MRLLQISPDGGFRLTEDRAENEKLQYAILSHTWGEDGDEVTFDDLNKGTGAHKEGYKKISFCAQQALRDRIHYIWVDTCCIKKSNNAITIELQHAINSMFKWYKRAAVCYVYLSDVPNQSDDANSQSRQYPFEPAFQKSRWFTRGWTLQELIAPASVRFFSKTWENIGSKESLERQISEITKIPVEALRGSPLDGFSVAERISWAEMRHTRYEEDKVYSLLGMFGVHLLPNYGEGKDYAFQRLHEEIQRVQKGVLPAWILALTRATSALLIDCRTTNFGTGRNSVDFSVNFNLASVAEIDQFVAREKELAQMHDILHGDGSRRVAVLHGLGGIGKTQLAITYAKRHRHNYSAVFWLNIKDEDSLKQSFARVAGQILQEHPSASFLSTVDLKDNLNAITDAVKSWLSLPNNTRWLLIYDNYDNPKIPGNTDPAAVDVRGYLPEGYQGSVIITTRSSQATLGRRIHIKKLEDVQDSLTILANSSRREVSADGGSLDIVYNKHTSLIHSARYRCIKPCQRA